MVVAQVGLAVDLSGLWILALIALLYLAATGTSAAALIAGALWLRRFHQTLAFDALHWSFAWGVAGAVSGGLAAAGIFLLCGRKYPLSQGVALTLAVLNLPILLRSRYLWGEASRG